MKNLTGIAAMLLFADGCSGNMEDKEIYIPVKYVTCPCGKGIQEI
jgi:hypothetical protein